VRAELAIGLHRAGDGSVVARGALAVPPYWCRWDGSTLWIVGSAATPVGDDDITLRLDVGEGVTATVRSVAATIVYAARGEGTRLTTRLHVASGASLTWQPDPVIVTARARHRSLLVAEVAAGGTLIADEVVVLGRTDEDAGRFASTTDLRREDEPICLTSFDTATPGWAGPGGTAGAKVIGTRVVLDPIADRGDGPDGSANPVDERTVVLHPEAGGTLATTLASTPDQARAQLDASAPLPGDRRQAWSSISPLSIHDTPKRSTHAPNSGDQNTGSRGICTSPPSASASNTRRTSSRSS
jgi:urease accessory protein